MQINYIQNWNINKYKPLNKVNFTAQDPKQPKTFKPYIRRKKSRENIEEKRMLELKNYNIGTRLARIFIYAEKREYEKMLYLIKKDIPPLHAYNIAVDGTDNECARLLMLSKQGINISEHTNLANNEQSYQDLFVKLSKLGARESEISGFYYCSKTQQAKIFEMVDSGVSFFDALECVKNNAKIKIYNANIKRGYNPFVSGVLANFNRYDILCELQIQELAFIIRTIEKNSKNSSRLSRDLSSMFDTYDSVTEDLVNFSEYLYEIDFKKIKEIAPSTKRYSSGQMLTLLKEHYEKGTKDFNKESLTFNEDLTQYIANNFVNVEDMNKILTAYPLTNREVGKIPDDWLEKVEDKEEAHKAIYKAIHKFQHNKNTNDLAQTLQSIINKNVIINRIGAGSFGCAYKISIENAKPVCLKIFDCHKNFTPIDIHGQNIEPQLGLFLNQHDESFVKMHFGQVVDLISKNGFIVTQFIDEETIPEKTKNANDGKYAIKYRDTNPSNKICGIIIDYGGTEVKETDN